MLTDGGVCVRVDGKVTTFDPAQPHADVAENVRAFVNAVIKDYSWLLQN